MISSEHRCDARGAESQTITERYVGLNMGQSIEGNLTEELY